MIKLLFAVVLITQASATKVEVKIDSKSDVIPWIVITDPEFSPMCDTLAIHLGAKNDDKPLQKEIMLRPKETSWADRDKAGEVWVATSERMVQIEVSSSALPKSLQKLRGPAVRAIRYGTCYFRHNPKYSSRTVTFLTVHLEEAEAVVELLHPRPQ